MTITDDLPSYLPDGVISIDADQIIVFANGGAGWIFGHEPETLIGQPLEILIPHDRRAAHRAHVDRFLQSDEAGRFMGQRGEITGLRANGEEFPAEASFFKSLSGSAPYLTAVVRDITERKRREREIVSARKAAEEANQAKDHLIASINHELRTPLNAIIGFSSVIENEIYGEIQKQKYIEAAGNIRTSAEHLLELVNDILRMKSLQIGTYELHEEIVNLYKIAAESCLMNEPAANSKDVGLENHIPESKYLLGDPKLIRQILINTIGNAIKFTSSGGIVQVSIEENTQQYLALLVTDTGKGICQNDLPNVTQAFHQGSTDSFLKADGMGLGLSLVKAMIESHGGHVDIQSTKNIGTSVSLRFPAWRIR